jgi:hypothetical protein
MVVARERHRATARRRRPMKQDMNTTGRYMRIAGALVILLMVSFSVYYNFFYHSVTRDVDKILDDLGRSMVDQMIKDSCHDPASDSCLDLVKGSISNGASCDEARPRINAAMRALRAGLQYSSDLRTSWQALNASCERNRL